MIRWYILCCLLAAMHCQSFHTNQHLPLQNFPSPWRYQHQPYYPAVAPSKNDYQSETSQSGDFNDLLRQYQQWQVAIPNQQGGVVWINAPVHSGQSSPSNAPDGYPPAPTPSSSSSINSNPGDTIVRDTVVTTGNEETSSSTSTSAPSSSPETPITSTPSWNASSSTSESTNTATIGTIATTESTTVSSNGTTTPSPSNSSNPLLKYCKKPRGQFPDPSDCSKFINCWDGTAFEQSCPSGLVFNSEKEYCDYPENVNCTSVNSTSTSAPPSNTSTTSNPNSTPLNPKCPSYYGTHRNASNCAAFYVCVYGEPVDFVCPTGTYYNDNLGVCDYEDRVDCKGASSTAAPPSSSTSETNSTSTTEPSSTSSTNATQSPSWSSTESPSSSTTSESTSSASTTSESTSSTSSSTPAETTSSSTTEPPSSTAPIQPPEGAALPGVDPIGFYNLNLKKLPESIVNTGVRCYHQNTLFRLTPDCSSVTVCNEGLTYIVNCGQATSFDSYSQRCLPTSRARC